MSAAKRDEEIIAQSLEYNRGDVALGRKPNQQRTPGQKFALRGNIEPGDIINRDHPNDNFQYTWVPFADLQYYYDCKEEGYKPVVEAEWINRRETREWYLPEKERWKWDAHKFLVQRDEFLMYRNEDLWKAEQKRRLQLQDEEINGRRDTAVETAARINYDKRLGIEIDVNGKPNVAGVRRTTV